jgi:hypothetical protein
MRFSGKTIKQSLIWFKNNERRLHHEKVPGLNKSRLGENLRLGD